MRVFISSTVFDLIDVRCELGRLLGGLKLSPVLSDDKLSDFLPAVDVNSIETCLLNVESCDLVIVILDQRYGPRLGDYGFDNVSATHLEYRHAKKHKKPIHLFVRDRLEADFHIWKKNKEAESTKLSWINRENIGLLEFLKEHRELRPDDCNWLSIFTSSVDLKEAVSKRLEPTIKPRVLAEAMQNNRFPLFVREVTSESIHIDNIRSIHLRVSLKNIGLSPAFQFTYSTTSDASAKTTIPIVGVGQEVAFSIIAPFAPSDSHETTVHCEYQSFIGVLVRESFNVGFTIQRGNPPSIISGSTQVGKTYHISPVPSISIEPK